MNIRRVKSITYKEFIHLFRDFRSLAVMIVMPVLLLILFGYALKLDVENVPTAIVDFDKSARSKEYIANFVSSRTFQVKYFPDNQLEAEALLNDGKIKLFLVIEKGFAKKLVNLKPAHIQAIFDGTDVTIASSIMNYIATITARYNSEELVKILKKSDMKIQQGSVMPEVRFWFNEDMNSVNYLFPGLMAIILSAVAGFLTSLTISREWETGTMEQLIPTPITETEIIIGKLITYFIIGFIDIILYIFMGEFIFDVNMKGNAIYTFFFSSLFIMSMLTFGIFISIVMKTQLASSQITTLATILPAFLLSGFVFDIGNMPKIIQIITYVFPARYFIEILRGIYLKGVGFEYLFINGLFIFFYALILFILCIVKLKLRAD